MARKLAVAELRKRARKIRCLFLDIDGVLTDGKLYLTPDGQELKAVNVRDGYGIKALLRAGLEVAVISGRPSAAMQKRLEFLGVRHVYLNTEDKLPAYDQVCAALRLKPGECAVMGDDLPDLPMMQRAGLALVPSDAHESAIAQADWVSRYSGGNGAVREACDLLLAARPAS